jgi:hypothetical protein
MCQLPSPRRVLVADGQAQAYLLINLWIFLYQSDTAIIMFSKSGCALLVPPVSIALYAAIAKPILSSGHLATASPSPSPSQLFTLFSFLESYN